MMGADKRVSLQNLPHANANIGTGTFEINLL